MIAVLKYLKIFKRENSSCHKGQDRMALKWQQSRLLLKKKTFLLSELLRQSKSLSWEAGQSPSLEVFRRKLHKHWTSMI